MKRWLTCLVALVLALALLVPALAETEYPDYLNLESQDPIIKEGAEAPKPKWMIVQDSTAGKWEDLWICRYFRERYNIEFDVESILNTALSERKSLMFSTGDLPDMMTGFGFSTAEILRYGQQEGMLLPMDEYFSETLTPNICKTLQDETIRATATTPDGHMYTLPNVGSLMDEGGYARVFVNRTWMTENGYDELPTTLEDFVNLLYAYKEANPESYPMGGGFQSTFGAYYILNALGYITTNNYGESAALRNGEAVIPAYDTEVYGEYLKLMNQFYNDGIINPNFVTMDNTECIAQLSAGQTFFYGNVVYTTGLPTWSDWEAPYPLTSAWNDKQQWPLRSYVTVGNFALSATTPYTALCLRFADIYFADDVRDMWLGPAKDSPYRHDDEGYIYCEYDPEINAQHFDQSRLEDGIDQWTYLMQVMCGFMPSWGTLESDAAYTYWYTSRGGTFDPYNKTFDITQPDPQYRISVYHNLVPYATETFPYVYYLDEETNDAMVDLQTVINPYIEEQVALFITGGRPLDQIDAFKTELESMGIQDLLKIYQDIYAASK